MIIHLSLIHISLKAQGRTFALRHCANSGAVAYYPDMWLDMVRPGILLYGLTEMAEELGLKSVMSLKTCVSTIKIYEPGAAISYGRTYKTDRRSRCLLYTSQTRRHKSIIRRCVERRMGR